MKIFFITKEMKNKKKVHRKFIYRNIKTIKNNKIILFYIIFYYSKWIERHNKK